MACVFFCPERKWGSMAQIFRVERTKNFTVMSNHQRKRWKCSEYNAHEHEILNIMKTKFG